MTAASDSNAVLTVARELAQAAAAFAARDDEDGRYATAADRLARSVIRPLAAGGDDDAEPATTGRDVSRGEWDEALWSLVRDATTRCAGPGRSAGLLEATAALQHLATSRTEDAESRAGRRLELDGLCGPLAPEIRAAHDGPYLVTNPRRLESWLGVELETTPQMALCRCGRSQLEPLCDGSHAEVGFSDAKDHNRVPDRRDTFVGQQLTILDNRGICQHSGLCTDRLAGVFHTGDGPFVTPSGGRMDEIMRAVRDCPSGALSYAIDGVEARDDSDHHGHRESMIQVTRDGPYRVTGGVALVDGDGSPVPRDAGASTEHYALCRCGQSQNKPFCSGMHWYVDFHDPAPEADRTPTMFEWCGGLPALTRMTRIFYEKYVPQDPLLAPLFATMSADHPERVAKWLGEVFGGPPRYSEEYGGYPRMLSQHLGKGLTEEWRARWVTLLLRSARDAGLPNDAEFRSAFQSYIEWGSRLAVENSQTAATPPQHMPMPHWDWHTAAGPPGSRITPLAPPSADLSPPVVLPAADEAVSFETHIRPLFRERDRKSMSFAFDLWSHDDVSAHAHDILERVRNGSMPCDQAWPEEWVAALARWIEAGMPDDTAADG